MSSSRKRAAVKKAENRTNFLEQKLMLTEYHLNCYKTIAHIAAVKHDEKQLEIFELKIKYCPESMTEEDKKLYETLKTRIEDAKKLSQGVTDEKAIASSSSPV